MTCEGHESETLGEISPGMTCVICTSSRIMHIICTGQQLCIKPTGFLVYVFEEAMLIAFYTQLINLFTTVSFDILNVVMYTLAIKCENNYRQCLICHPI